MASWSMCKTVLFIFVVQKSEYRHKENNKQTSTTPDYETIAFVARSCSMIEFTAWILACFVFLVGQFK